MADVESERVRWAVTLLRAMVASVFVIHGTSRVALGIVDDFAVFLRGAGMPFGAVVAWALTSVEIVGGLILAAGHGVRPLVSWFGVQLVAGLLLVHGREGWFVVGAGRNGAEYSLLILVCLVVVAMTNSIAYRLPLRSR